MVTLPLESIAIASVSEAEPIFPPFEITREPPLIAPVVVIVDEPVSIAQNPDVIDPAFNAPTVVTFESVSNALSK